MSKKAQFEIIGLAIVVTLVVLGMFIVIKLQLLEEPTRVEKSYGQTQLASNFLNTMLSTNTDCGERLVRELLIDCADLTAIMCADGKNSCPKAEEIISQILSQTLEKWNKKYLLTMRKTGNTLIAISDKVNECIPEEMEHEAPGIYYYNLEHGGTLTIRLDLCY